MTRPPSPGILGLSLAALVLAGCAGKSPLHDPFAPKCYVIDTTRHISPDEHARIFRGVETEGHAFPPCDSASPDAVRIRPQFSWVASPPVSYIMLGVDLAVLGAGFGAGLAYGRTSWLMMPALHLGPTASLVYQADYTDAKGKKRQEWVSVGVESWFKTREESKPRLLEHSRRVLSTTLFGKEYPRPVDKHFGRLSIDLEPLMVARTYGGIYLESRFEKFLPRNFALGAAPAAFFPFSMPYREYSLHGGPRWYAGPNHSGPFLGLEPYAERAHYHGNLYSRIALPVTVGLVFQGRRLVTSLDLGIGPSKVLNGAYKEPHYLTLSSLYVGYRF
jgi:hypothetical protein